MFFELNFYFNIKGIGSLPYACVIETTNSACHAEHSIQTRHDIKVGLAFTGTWNIFNSKLGLTANARVKSRRHTAGDAK